MPKYIPTADDLHFIRSFRDSRNERGLSNRKNFIPLMTYPIEVYEEYKQRWGPEWPNMEKYQIEFLRENPQYKIATPDGLSFRANK